MYSVLSSGKRNRVRACPMRLAAVAALSVLLLSYQPARAGFTYAGSVSLTSPDNHHGIAFDGTNWHIADPFNNNYHNYSSSFTYLNDTTVSGVADMRGLTYDPNSNDLFVNDYQSHNVFEVTVGGIVVSSFNTGNPGLNGLAYDRRDNTMWLLYFGGLIEKRSRTGTLISSFNTSLEQTGIALDPVSNTLLTMESDSDSVDEYRFDGTLVGQVITTDQIPFNGQGLAYDPSIGRLYATSQQPGVVTFFDDPSRVPEPSGVAMGAIAMALLRRRRR
jgi:hypothetical protein